MREECPGETEAEERFQDPSNVGIAPILNYGLIETSRALRAHSLRMQSARQTPRLSLEGVGGSHSSRIISAG